jgi:hypothetical protein
MAVGDVYRFAFVWKSISSSKVAVNNFYLKQNGPLILDTPTEDFWGIFQESCLELYRFSVASELGLIQLVGATGLPFVTEQIIDIEGVVGGSGGGSLPTRTAGILSYRTAVPTKKGRGRVFLPPAGEGDNAAGRPSSGWLTNTNGFAQALFDLQFEAVGSASWQWHMYSKTDNVFRPVTAAAARTKWGSRRKRDLY